MTSSAGNLSVQLHLPYTCCTSLESSRCELFCHVSVLTQVVRCHAGKSCPPNNGCSHLYLHSQHFCCPCFFPDFRDFCRLVKNQLRNQHVKKACNLRQMTGESNKGIGLCVVFSVFQYTLALDCTWYSTVNQLSSVFRAATIHLVCW